MGTMQTDGRQETPNERADRNWNELLQELRVMQTGVQILTGFLLTLPFQSRFADLDQYQVNVYLALVIAAVVATALIVAPVSVHRVLFRKRMKGNIVTLTDRITRIALAVLALVITGVAVLVFDVVVGRTAGIVAGSAALVVMVLLWVLLPEMLRRRG
jgi:multisubunit Na+/H+ antiporter MnhE subunit